MKIRGMKVRNFRSINEIKIGSIGDSIVLIGKNNVGKSAILNAIGMFFGEKRPQKSDFHKGDTSKPIEIELIFELGSDDLDVLLWDKIYGIEKFPNDKRTKEFREELQDAIKNKRINVIKDHQLYENWKNALKKKFGINLIDGKECLTISLKITTSEKGFSQKYVTLNGAELKKPQLDKLLPYLVYISDERNFSDEEQSKRNTWTEKLIQLYWKESMEKITEIEHDLQENIDKMIEKYEQEINRFFQEYYRGYKIKLDPDIDIKKAVNINVKIQIPEVSNKIPLTYVGAGVRSMYLVSLLEAYLKLTHHTDAIFVLEEPEIYLHPELQKKMADILYRISRMPKNQVFFSTHSPLLLRHFDISKIKHVKLSSNKTKIEDAKLSQILDDLGYSTEDVIHKEFVVIVEGPDDTRRIENILAEFMGWPQRKVREKIYFLEARGSKGIGAYATIRFMGRTTLKDNFAIIRDSDTIDPKKIKERLIDAYVENVRVGKKRLRDRILVLKYASLENYFIDHDVLMSMGVIKSKDEYVTMLKDFVSKNRDKIRGYWKKKRENEDKGLDIDYYDRLLFSEDISEEDFIENCKRLIRGHDLYNYFWNTLIAGSKDLKRRFKSKDRYGNEYINTASWKTFAEILDFFSNFEYFKLHLSKEKTEKQKSLTKWVEIAQK